MIFKKSARFTVFWGGGGNDNKKETDKKFLHDHIDSHYKAAAYMAGGFFIEADWSRNWSNAKLETF